MTPREGQKKAFQESSQRIVHSQAHAATGISQFQSIKGEETGKTIF
jgi:hypothetical protein